MTVVLPFRSYSSLIDHSCFKNASYLTLRRISLNFNLSGLFNISPPSKYGTNFAAIISKLFLTLTNEESFITWFIHMIKSCKKWEYHFLVPYQELITVLNIAILLQDLYFWFIYHFLLSFDYFQVTIQHDTI